MFIEFIVIVIDPVVLRVYIALVVFGIVEHVPQDRQFVEFAPYAVVALEGVTVCTFGCLVDAHPA